MRFLRIIVFICVAVVSGTVSAQSQRELSQLMRERNEYYFTLNVNDRAEIQVINSICSVDGTDGRIVVCYANQQQYDRLLQVGYQPTLMTPPSMLDEAVMWDGSNRATYEWDSYPTYDAYQSMMEAFPSQALSDRSCTLLDLGTLSSGRKILGVRLNNGQPDGKPRFLYSSTMHGDEVTGMMLMLRLIDEFCTSTDSRIVNILNTVDLFIFPLTNPDGTYYGGNSTMNSARRYNINGVDLNRNYKDYYNGDHPDGNAWALETQWTMQLAQDYLFTMSANYHGGAEVMNYPWDAVYDDHPDKAWWQLISAEYVSNARANNSSYMTDTYSSGVTNGADWYVITGSRQDYENAYGECREITVECSSTKKPSASTMPTYWNYNHTAMLAFIEQCTKGIHGIVYDANTNLPIVGATITVLGHDNDLSKVTTHNVGDFHRPIKGGNWTIKVTKEGYCTEQINATIADGQRVDLEVYLTPEGDCPVAPVVLNCYEQMMPSAAGDYVMGYLNGSTFVMPSHNNSSTVTTTSIDVTSTDNGFSVEQETAVPQVSLTAYGNGQYYISYNGRYLTRSSYGLNWSTSTSSSGRWYINANGIYVTSNNRNYYLYYNNGSFTTSTTQQNNITFYVEGDCPTPVTSYTITASANPTEGGTLTGTGQFAEGESCTLTATANEGYTFVGWAERGEVVSSQAIYSFEVTRNRTLEAIFEANAPGTVTQTSTFGAGWNWWTPNVDVTLAQLETAIGSNGLTIMNQNGDTQTYYPTYGWIGDAITIEAGQMYKIQTGAACTVSLEGTALNPAEHSITLHPGTNWIGFYGTQSMTVGAAMANYTATDGDAITSQQGATATYYATYGWIGDLTMLVPGEAYLYSSKAAQNSTFTYPSNSK